MSLSSTFDCQSASASAAVAVAVPNTSIMDRPYFFAITPLVHIGTSFVIVAIMLLVLCATILIAQRRNTRRILEGGRCNLPTVMWRPRFWNYSSTHEGVLDGRIQGDGEIDWDDDNCVVKWAKEFVREQQHHHSTPLHQQSSHVQGRKCDTKMGSSSITNILPRMERLNGPYGMYATVYGVRTKVVHVGHYVPARAILTGAGVIELDDREGVVCTQKLEGKNLAMKTIRRSSSSTIRLLTGSTKNPAYDHFKNFSGDGVFTANGSDWKAKRASVIHCLLRNSNTDTMLELEANRAADSFIREVSYEMEVGRFRIGDDDVVKQTKNPTMNVVPMLQRATVGLIYRLITHHNVEFGPVLKRDLEKKPVGKDESITDQTTSSSTSASSSPRSSAASLMTMERDENTKQSTKCTSNHSICDEREKQIKLLLSDYLQSVTRIRMIILAQSRSIWFLLPRWVYRAFSPMYREEEQTMISIRKFSRMACENAVSGSPIAQLRQRESHISSDTASLSLSANVSKDLLDEAITLLFAGQDTSAATLSWTLHLLSLHRDMQEKVVKELRFALGDDRCNVVSKSMISQMPYLDAVIKESMRLYPVAPFIVRMLTTDITIPIDEKHASNNDNARMNTTTLPATSFACIWIYALHRNPKLWDRPNDFLPERWIDPALRSRDLGQEEYGGYMPFAIGPRNCLGQPLAQVILRIVLARILHTYVVIDPKFEALKHNLNGVTFDPNSFRKDMQAGFTVLPSNGLNIQLVEREHVVD